MQSPLGVIFQRDGSAKNCHDAIADELIDHSLVLVDGVGQVLQALVHERGDLFWVERFRQSGKSRNVGKNNGHLASLALNVAGRSDLVGELPRNVILQLREQIVARTPAVDGLILLRQEGLEQAAQRFRRQLDHVVAERRPQCFLRGNCLPQLCDLIVARIHQGREVISVSSANNEI